VTGREGCLLGIGEAALDSKGEGEGKGDAARTVPLDGMAKSVSSPSSSPEISLVARGLREVDAGVELVREKLPLLLFMANTEPLETSHEGLIFDTATRSMQTVDALSMNSGRQKGARLESLRDAL